MEEGHRLGGLGLAIDEVVQHDRREDETGAAFGDGYERRIVQSPESLPEQPRRAGQHRIEPRHPFEGLSARTAQVGALATRQGVQRGRQVTRELVDSLFELSEERDRARVAGEP